MERDALKPSHAKWAKPVLVLQATEGAFDRSASPVEVAPPLRLARDERMEAGSLDPPARRRALTRRAAPLCPPALEVGSGERPRPVLAGRSAMLVALHRRCLAEGNDRQHARSLAGVVHGRHVVALVERRRLGLHSLTDALQEIVGKARLVRSRRRDSPGDRQIGSGATRHMELVPVEPAALPRGHLWSSQRDRPALLSSARTPAPPDLRRVLPAARPTGSRRRCADGPRPAPAARDR